MLHQHQPVWHTERTMLHQHQPVWHTVRTTLHQHQPVWHTVRTTLHQHQPVWHTKNHATSTPTCLAHCKNRFPLCMFLACLHVPSSTIRLYDWPGSQEMMSLISTADVYTCISLLSVFLIYYKLHVGQDSSGTASP